MFDIGRIYTRDGIYYLAVTNETLISYIDGRFSEYTTEETHSTINGLPVKKLCKYWGISIKTLDTAMAKYFAPNAEARERKGFDRLSDILEP